MTPTQAGFDGARGISLNHRGLPDGGTFRLRRGKRVPNVEKSDDLRNQLLWVMPDDADAKLLYCNDNNELFELVFIPLKQ
jgi:hypothetical protein